jgi:hypothetical protein
MRLELRRTSWLMVAHLGACTSVTQQPAPAAIQGESHDIRQLAGRWRGEFHNTHTGRVGTIFFDLRADRDTAYGDVTFDRVIPTAVCNDMTRPQTTSNVVVPVVLRFGALAVARGSIGGWLRPYRDPDLLCWMDTWFEGRLVRDTLGGSFFSRRTDTDTVRVGTWWAARTK